MLDELQILIKAQIDKVQSLLGMKSDLNEMGQNLSIPVTAKLDKTKSRQRLKKDLSEIDNQTIGVTAKINRAESRKALKDALKSLQSEQINIKGTFDKASLERIKKQIADLRVKTANGFDVKTNVDEKSLDKASDSIDRINKRSVLAMASVTLLYQAIRGLENAARDMVRTAADLDAQLTDLRLVTGQSYDEAAKLVKAYNGLAQELSATTSQMLEASNQWLRQGKSVEETNELIRQSMILSKVGAMAAADATKNLTSAMKGYGLEVENVSGIVDKLTAIDLKAAVSADDLAVAMSRTASSANIAGVSMDKLLSYLAVVQETTQKSAETIGESFKTIFARMGNVKLGKFLDDDGEDLSDVESTLKRFGIALRDTKDEFRSFEDVLDDVGKRWDNFTSIEQHAIANVFAGVRQQENFLVLMENYGTALELAGVAADSAGTSLKKFSAYEESIAAHANQFVAALESLSFNTLDAGLIKGFIDAGAALIRLIDNLHLLEIGLNTIAAVGAVKGFGALVGGAKTLYDHISRLSSAFNILETATKGNLGVTQFNQLLATTKGLSAAQLRLIVSNQALTTKQRMALLTANGMTAAQAKQTLATLGLATAEGTATAATFSLSGAMKALTATIAANPIGFLIIGLTVAISAISSAVSSYNQAQEEARQKSVELSNAMKDQMSRIDELRNKLKDESISRETLIELMSSHNQKYGEELSAINDVNEAREKALALLDEEAKRKAEETVRENGSQYIKQKEFLENPNYVPIDDIPIWGTPEEALKQLGNSLEMYQKKIEEGTKLSWFESEALKTLEKAYANTKKKIEDATAVVEAYETAQSILNGTYTSTNVQGTSVVDDSAQNVERYTRELESLKDVISSVQSAYSALESAQEDIDAGHGLSAETIQKLAAVTDDYIDYLIEENGQLTLNTVAWKNMADAKFKAEMTKINLETESLRQERDEIERNIEAINQKISEYMELVAQYGDDPSFREEIYKQEAAINSEKARIEEINKTIEDNQALLSKYGIILGTLQSIDLSNVTNGLDAIKLATDGMSGIISAIDSYSNSMSTLVSVQEALANSFTITLAQAKEFAAVYPEILNGATVTADGQIVLNEAVANSLIEAKRAEINAEIDADVAKLEATKMELTAKKASAEAQLELANAVAEGEIDIENAKVQLLADAEQVLTQYLIDLGVSEVDASLAAAEAKAGNMEEYARIVGNVADDNANNLANSMAAAASATQSNIVNMVSSLDALGRQVANVASQIANIGTGTQTYNGRVSVGGGSAGGTGFSASYGNYNFSGINGSTVDVFNAALGEWKKKLELDISGYTSAIAQIDGQIAALQALKNLPLSSYKGGLGGGGSGGGGGGSAKEVEEYIAAINKLYAAEEHLKDIQEQRTYAQAHIDASGKTTKQIEYMREIISLYEQEQDALHEINELRRDQTTTI